MYLVVARATHHISGLVIDEDQNDIGLSVAHGNYRVKITVSHKADGLQTPACSGERNENGGVIFSDRLPAAITATIVIEARDKPLNI